MHYILVSSGLKLLITGVYMFRIINNGQSTGIIAKKSGWRVLFKKYSDFSLERDVNYFRLQFLFLVVMNPRIKGE